MTDRLTDKELSEVGAWYQGPAGGDPDVVRVVAEVQEHRAARTLTDEERNWVAEATIRLDADGEAYPFDMLRLLAIIDRITEGSPDA